jgi:beta-glucuronidase
MSQTCETPQQEKTRVMDKTGNFQESIHETDFEAPYLSKTINADSLICDYYRPKESLNGNWNFGIDQYDNCLRARWFEECYTDEAGRPYPVDFSFDAWEQIKVPSCWNLHAEKYFLYEGSAVYTRKFTYKNHGEKRVFLKFGGVNYEAKVFLNKQYLGRHRGGSTPFYIEVTGLLTQSNRLLVVANNTRKRTNVPCENTDWFNYGGIYRDVELLRLPETFVKDFFLSLVPGTGFKKVRAAVQVDGPEKAGRAVIRIDELHFSGEIPLKNGSGTATFDLEPRLWSPENPKLYDVVVSYQDDVLPEKIGFREIRTEGTRIFLNGESIYLRGICAHEESVENGKSVTEEEIRENFRLAKELNCNYLRLAHYPHSEQAARLADEVGMMLWEEIPVYWAIDFGAEDTYRDAENQLTELIFRDRNRGSVVLWSVGNENADTDSRLDFMRSLARKAKELDGTRLVSAACLVDHQALVIADRLIADLDVIAINEYYGWYEPDFSKLSKIFQNSHPSKPVIISEFGADAKTGARGTRDDLYTEDHQSAVYARQIETLGQISSVRGTTPWILFDFRCPRRLHSMQNYYNLKGLLSADKKHKKLAFALMQKFYLSRRMGKEVGTEPLRPA